MDGDDFSNGFPPFNLGVFHADVRQTFSDNGGDPLRRLGQDVKVGHPLHQATLFDRHVPRIDAAGVAAEKDDTLIHQGIAHRPVYFFLDTLVGVFRNIVHLPLKIDLLAIVVHVKRVMFVEYGEAFQDLFPARHVAPWAGQFQVHVHAQKIRRRVEDTCDGNGLGLQRLEQGFRQIGNVRNRRKVDKDFECAVMHAGFGLHLFVPFGVIQIRELHRMVHRLG